MPKQQRYVVEEVLRVPADIQSDSKTQSVADQQKRISRETRERLLGSFVITDALNDLRLVSVVRKILAQARCEVPDADHKERQHDHAAHRRKHHPELRTHHREKESR